MKLTKTVQVHISYHACDRCRREMECRLMTHDSNLTQQKDGSWTLDGGYYRHEDWYLDVEGTGKDFCRPCFQELRKQFFASLSKEPEPKQAEPRREYFKHLPTVTGFTKYE